MEKPLKVYRAGQDVEKAEGFVLLCHGFGANGADLMGLASYLDKGSRFSWLFPEAPVPMPEEFPGYAWYPRDLQRLYRVMAGDYFDNLDNLYDKGLDDSASEIATLIGSLNLSNRPLVLGGFSQGSHIALRVVLRWMDFFGTSLPPPKTLVLFSSSLIDKSGTMKLLATSPKVPVIQSHGMWDQVLPLRSAKSLKDLLIASDYTVDWIEFQGAHEIPDEALTPVETMLSKLV